MTETPAYPDRQLRTFTPRTVYTSNGWFSEVYADNADRPYMFRAAFTRWGADRKASRLARRLNRMERKGVLK